MMHKSANDAIVKLLEEKLKKYVIEEAKLTLATCSRIYQDIFETLVDVMRDANINITNESMNYLSQQYYDAVTITNKGVAYELDPDIFTQRAKLENIETKELALIATMMSGTPFAVPLIHEIKKRS